VLDPLTVAGEVDGTLAGLLFEAHPTAAAKANAARAVLTFMETSTARKAPL
jgi:hypothetical protein